MADLEYLANYMFGLSGSIPNKVNAIKQTLAASILEGVIKDTPVDIGMARSNWIISLGEADDTVIDPYFPSHKAGLAETENADAAIAAGQEKASQSLPGESIWIQNNVRYVPFLNYPPVHSAQADAFFVETAVSEAVNQFDGVRFVFAEGIFK